MNLSQYAVEITKELERTVAQVDDAAAEKLAGQILNAGKIFAAGAGRSGFMMRAFAMRLMHMGLTAYVVGETVTPNLEPGDLLLIGSGSGETGSLVSMARKAAQIGANLALITIYPESSIGALADPVLTVPAPTPKGDTDSGFRSIQPMGSLFEQSLLILLDGVILRLMERKGLDSGTMFTRHANLE